ncbi:hypothetical protein M413DRAFT_21055 [Hebeloma cylindrosporum]|uniref:Ubiquitin-like domain-containing protein n=1 Tax=Hebeloma cylindrosporum TaxID=76867 RepID=A0A0C2YG73_HEBCY|nr:hypothetical protein M413DRAFT_21055 [Hebeloma cylindrosporum h7]
MARFNTIAVHITVKDSSGIEQHVLLPNVKRPVEYGVLVEQIRKMGEDIIANSEKCNSYTHVLQSGYPAYFAFSSQTEFKLEVTAGQSSFDEASGGAINLDQPLIAYYNDCYLPAAYPQDEERPEQCSAAEILSDQKIKIGGLATVGFQRTIRVPDNNKTHALPPDMGPFPVYNMADIDHLPKQISSKGGVCIPMYQREAMWISFGSIADCAVKVSVGGINALTGHSQSFSKPGKQDYLAVSRSGAGQLWLDGISTSPGVVRKFVAVPLGKGLTVEGQLTGSETQGGVQIDIFPLLPSTVSFYPQRNLPGPMAKFYNSYKTPRQLALSPMIEIVNVVAGNHTLPFTLKKAAGRSIQTTPSSACIWKPSLIRVITLTGKTLTIKCSVLDIVDNLKARIKAMERIPCDQQRLIYAGIQLEGGRMLGEYKIHHGATVRLVLSLRGGGGEIFGGVAVGGRISQKIYKDPLPPFAYDYARACRLHVTIINSAHFTALTGLPTPRCPIKTSTYIKHGLPWYELYDEHVPVANNTSTPNSLNTVKTLGTLLAQASPSSNRTSKDIATECVYCDYEFAVMTLRPCGHDVCEGCSTVTRCPSCRNVIVGRDRFAASMGTMAAEHDMGVESGSNNERIVRLRLNSGTHKVVSFKEPRHAVSPLNGDGKD